ncbi:MAG: putative DNA repair protein MutK [Moritella sp.]|jgi:predicted DNA repair protein MutK
MAGLSLLALLDDIAFVLDDVALMAKVAAKKTAGVLGDDLALNAEQVSGISADRELPVVWQVAKGSFKNKAILVPAALLISAIAPWLITPLLLIGGLFLCFEGAEKIVHSLSAKSADATAATINTEHSQPVTDLPLEEYEDQKVKGAIRTDFCTFGRDHCHRIGHSAEPAVKHCALCCQPHRYRHDSGCIRTRSGHCQDG